jgi:hypothetical protein
MKRTILAIALLLSVAGPALAAPVMPAAGRTINPAWVPPPITKQVAAEIAGVAVGGGMLVAIHRHHFQGRRTWRVIIDNGKHTFIVQVDLLLGNVLHIRKLRDA